MTERNFTIQNALTQGEKTVILIDGSNMWAAAKELNFHVDFNKLRELLMANCNLLRAYYYSALLPGTKEENSSPLIPVIDFLRYNHYHVVTKKAYARTRQTEGGEEKKFIKGNVDIEMAVDMMLAAQNGAQHIILASGDGDFRRVVEYCQSLLVKVSVLSTLETQWPFVSDELRRQADYFIELADMKNEIILENERG